MMTFASWYFQTWRRVKIVKNFVLLPKIVFIWYFCWILLMVKAWNSYTKHSSVFTVILTKRKRWKTLIQSLIIQPHSTCVFKVTTINFLPINLMEYQWFSPAKKSGIHDICTSITYCGLVWNKCLNIAEHPLPMAAGNAPKLPTFVLQPKFRPCFGTHHNFTRVFQPLSGDQCWLTSLNHQLLCLIPILSLWRCVALVMDNLVDSSISVAQSARKVTQNTPVFSQWSWRNKNNGKRWYNRWLFSPIQHV